MSLLSSPHPCSCLCSELGAPAKGILSGFPCNVKDSYSFSVKGLLPSNKVGHPLECCKQVLLSVGMDGDARKAFLNGPAHGGDHLHRLMKFVTMRTERGRDRSGIQAPGGPVDPSVDGDPTLG